MMTYIKRLKAVDVSFNLSLSLRELAIQILLKN